MSSRHLHTITPVQMPWIALTSESDLSKFNWGNPRPARGQRRLHGGMFRLGVWGNCDRIMTGRNCIKMYGAADFDATLVPGGCNLKTDLRKPESFKLWKSSGARTTK
jgi:hypothetical protein